MAAINSICHANNGNFVCTGLCQNKINDPQNTYLCEFDPNGQIVWQKQIKLKDHHIDGMIMKQIQDGYIICGTSHDLLVGKYKNIYLLKTNEVGEIIWFKNYIVDNNIAPFGLIQTFDKGFAITGIVQNPANNDGLFLKLDAKGEIEWSKSYDRVKLDWFYDIKEINPKEFLIEGSGYYDAYMLKLGTNGEILFSNKFTNNPNENLISNVIQFQNDSLLWFNNTIRLYDSKDPSVLMMIKSDKNGNVSCNQDTAKFVVKDINFTIETPIIESESFTSVGVDINGVVSTISTNNFNLENYCLSSSTLNQSQNEGLIFTVSPNPGFGDFTFHIDFKNNCCSKNRELNIYNNYGTKVYSASLPTSDNSIELSNKGFVSGVYYAVVRESGQIVKTLKFIKY